MNIKIVATTFVALVSLIAVNALAQQESELNYVHVKTIGKKPTVNPCKYKPSYFRYPHAIAIDHDRRIIVSQPSHSYAGPGRNTPSMRTNSKPLMSAVVFSPSHKYVHSINFAKGLRYDRAQNCLAVAVFKDNSILFADQGRGEIFITKPNGDRISFLEDFKYNNKKLHPVDVFIDSEELIWILGINRVLRFDKNLNCLGEWKVRLLSPDSSFNVSCITMDSKENVYLGVSNYGFISVYTKSGELIKNLGGDGELPGPFGWIGDMTIDKEDRIIVTDTKFNRVQIFSNNGELIKIIGGDGQDEHGSGSKEGEFRRPTGVAVDHEGNIVVVDSENCRLQLFSHKGDFVKEIGGGGDINGHTKNIGDAPGEFTYPHSITVTLRGDVYVLDFGENWMEVFSSDGIYKESWGSELFPTSDNLKINQLNKAFPKPPIRALHSDDEGNIYVYNDPKNQVEKYGPNSQFLNSWKGSDKDFYFRFVSVEKLATDSKGNIYTLDDSNFSISKFDHNGNLLLILGGDHRFPEAKIKQKQRKNSNTKRVIYYSGLCYPRKPKDIEVDHNGHIYVLDQGSDSIEVFDNEGNLTRHFRTDIQIETNLGRSITSNPHSFALDRINKRILVLSFNCVIVFSYEGEFLGNFGNSTITLYENLKDDSLNGASDISVGPDGEVYVVSSLYNRVLVFQEADKVKAQSELTPIM